MNVWMELELAATKTYNQLPVNLIHSWINWRARQPFHSIPLHQLKQKRRNFFFIWLIRFIFEWNEEIKLKRYYNSMLKVISWYKIILNFGLVKAKWRVDFMNEMTFKPLPNQIHQFHFFSLWEWEKKLRIDWIWRALRPAAKCENWKFSMKLTPITPKSNNQLHEIK